MLFELVRGVLRRGRTLAFVSALASLPALPAFAATPTAPAKAESKAAEKSETLNAPTLPSLAEILAADERMDALEREVRKRFGDGARLKALGDTIAAAEQALQTGDKGIDSNAPSRVQMLALVDFATEMRAHAAKLQAIVDQLGSRVRSYDADLDRLKGLDAEWTARIDAARLRKAPIELQARIERVPSRIADLAREVTRRRDANFEVLEKATRLLGRLQSTVGDANERRDQLVESLSAVRGEPLWRAQPRTDARDHATAWAATELKQMHRYIASQMGTLAAIGIGAFALGLIVIAGARRRLDHDTLHDQDTEVARRLFRRPLLWALVIALVALAWQSPDAPVVYMAAVLTLLILVTVVLVLTVAGHRATLSLYVLACALALNWFQVGLDSLPYSGRTVLIVQCAVVAASLWLDLRRGRIANDLALLPPGVMTLLIKASIVVLLAAVVADILGYVGLARLMRDGVLRTIGLGLALNLLGRMVYGLIVVALRTQTMQRLRIVQYRTVSILSSARLIVRGAAVVGWFVGALFAFHAIQFTDSIQKTISGAQLQVGSVSLSAGAILLCVAILLITYITVRTIRLVLEIEILPRMTLRSATSFVISAATRYLLTVSGLILAMAALGIDFSRVTLLVSAVGVGIGFGLQNVVNNFVSGLLLLGERVINVGDTVEIGNLTGVVRRIGVRSSTVRTAQGAEVIVPNSNLTSNSVVNFTLNDRHRRLDISIGVGYDNDPDRIVHLLIEAAKAHHEVLGTPVPTASLVRFGDSALEFRLQAWIANYERGPVVETGLRTAILARFKAAHIEMPPPSVAAPQSA